MAHRPFGVCTYTMPSKPFKVGDYVVLKEAYYNGDNDLSPLVGQHGKVTEVNHNDGNIAVDFLPMSKTHLPYRFWYKGRFTLWGCTDQEKVL